MMRILVTFPTKLEGNSFRKIAPAKIDIAFTGVGVPSTIYQLLKLLNKTRYDLVIQAGICGSFDLNNLPIATSCIVKKDVFADLGIIENKQLISMYELGFTNKDEVGFKDGWLVNEGGFLKDLTLPKCSSITANTITDNLELTKIINEKYSPQLESMEGAALHYVCLLEGIKFLQLRTVSNLVGERDKTKWNIPLAVKNMTEDLVKVVEHFT